MDSSTEVGTPIPGSQPPEQNVKANSIPQPKAGSGLKDSKGSFVTSETVSRKALDKVASTFQVCSHIFFSLWFNTYLYLYNKQLWSIYTAGNTVPIPFLRATDISPIALLSDNVLGGWQQDNGGNIAVEAMQELFSGDAQPKKGRSRQNEVLFLLIGSNDYIFSCINIVS